MTQEPTWRDLYWTNLGQSEHQKKIRLEIYYNPLSKIKIH